MLSLIENASQSGGRATGSKLLEVPNFAPLVRMLPASLHSNSRYTYPPALSEDRGGAPATGRLAREVRPGLTTADAGSDVALTSARYLRIGDSGFGKTAGRVCALGTLEHNPLLTGALPALLTDRLTVMYKLGSVNTGDCCLWHKQPVNSL